MTDRNDGGPAFPAQSGSDWKDHQGMTLRDYFAAKALQGALACQSSEMGYFAKGEEATAAATAYAFADAMLLERAK